MKSMLYVVVALFSLIGGSLLFTGVPAHDSGALWVLVPGYLLIAGGIGFTYLALTCNHEASSARH